MKSVRRIKNIRAVLRGLLIFEVIVCYMALMTVVSHIRGPQRYEVISDMPLLDASDFTAFDGASAEKALKLSNQAPGTAVGYLAQLPLIGLERIHISFEVDCPAEYSGGMLILDLYNYESGYDSEEQEYRLTLQEGLNEVSVSLEPGEAAPEQAQFRVFTLDAAGYEVRNLQVCQETSLPKVTPFMLGVVFGCFVVLGLTMVVFCRFCDVKMKKQSLI